MKTREFRIGGIAGVVALFFLLLAGNVAYAALQSAGPVSLAHGFPEYYRDLNGQSLALCLDQNGFCNLPPVFDPLKNPAPASITDLATSITNTNFPDVSSYWAASVRQNVGPLNAVRFDLIMSLDATFGSVNKLAQNGFQQTALNITLKSMKGLTPGAYTVRHPFGQFTVTADGAGNTPAVKLTDPGAVGVFTTLLPATNTNIGPFLTCATGPVAGPAGELYIGDPRTPCTVVGGPRGNIVQVTGPDIGGTGVNSITVSLFSVAGKLIAMSASPASLTFPLQNGTAPSAPQVVTVTNVTNAALTPGAITSTIPDFTIPPNTNTCTVAIPASGACTFQVVFQGVPPDGVKTGTVNIAPPPGSPSSRIAVSGTLDTAPPVISLTVPANNASVASNSAIAVTFNEAVTNVNNTTFSLADSSGSPVAGTVALDAAGKTATFMPSAPLAEGAGFKATVKGGAAGVTDLAGNALAANAILSFTTVVPDTIPPTVVSKTPGADATDVNPTEPITVVFSEDMDSTTINRTTFNFSGAVITSVTYDQATRTATLTPSRPLDAGALFVVTVTTGVKDLAQNPLAADVTWKFLVDAGPSVPQLVSPADEAIVTGTTVDFQWTRAVDPDNDVITYQLYYCTNQQMLGCDPVIVASAAAPGTPKGYLAGAGRFGAGILLAGLIAAGVKGRKKVMFLIAMLLVAGTLASSCGGKSSSTPTTGAIGQDVITRQVTGLSPGTTYFWKVVADDGNGVLAQSLIRSFTTE